VHRKKNMITVNEIRYGLIVLAWVAALVFSARAAGVKLPEIVVGKVPLSVTEQKSLAQLQAAGKLDWHEGKPEASAQLMPVPNVAAKRRNLLAGQNGRLATNTDRQAECLLGAPREQLF